MRPFSGDAKSGKIPLNKAIKIMKTTVDKQVKRSYVVSDYSGIIDEFEKLKDARECLYFNGKGRFGVITSQTTETIIIKTEEVIQSFE